VGINFSFDVNRRPANRRRPASHLARIERLERSPQAPFANSVPILHQFLS
jgi:hypothetical protein